MAATKNKTSFWSLQARPQYWVALAITVALALGFLLGLNINGQ